MGLRYKFFTAFLITSFLIVALLVGIMQLFIYKNFSRYVNDAELERLDAVVEVLEDYYRENLEWKGFQQNRRLWRKILDQGSSGGTPQMARPPGPGSASGFGRGGDRPHALHRPPRPRPVDPLNLHMRLSLFDRDKNHIAGFIKTSDRFSYRGIVLDGKTKGWLGLKLVDGVKHPLGADFLRRQTHAFYLMGLGILILAGVLSFWLSRHFLSPIKELMKGTRALRSFDFSTPIQVSSKDELGMLSEDFNRMAKTLQQYETLRENWISDISHELRTPISILRSKLEAIQDGIREMTPEMLASLNRDVLRLGKLVEDLHLLSLADSHNLKVQKTAVKPALVLKEGLDSCRFRLEKEQIQVQVQGMEEPHAEISGDRELLSRLFLNLIENAIRYTDGPGMLKIISAKEEQWLVITLEDSKPGVPDDCLERLFERLFRVDGSRSRARGGSGLGLSIVKKIVATHHGYIQADHSDLGGLMITIRLPLISK